MTCVWLSELVLMQTCLCGRLRIGTFYASGIYMAGSVCTLFPVSVLGYFGLLAFTPTFATGLFYLVGTIFKKPLLLYIGLILSVISWLTFSGQIVLEVFNCYQDKTFALGYCVFTTLFGCVMVSFSIVIAVYLSRVVWSHSQELVREAAEAEEQSTTVSARSNPRK